MIQRNSTFIIDELKSNNYTIDTVYDIGANKGEWTKEWKKNLPQANFYLFEANPSIKLKGNFFNSVLSDQDDKDVKFYLPNMSDSYPTGASYYKEASVYYSQDRYIDVKTKKLDTLINDNSLPLPDFIKLDTQGSEPDILKGSTEALKECKVITCEMPIMPYNENAPEFSECIKILKDSEFIPSGCDKIDAKTKGIFNQIDIVFVKRNILEKIHNFSSFYKGY